MTVLVISRTFITTKQVSPVIDPVLPVDALICHCVYVVAQLYIAKLLQTVPDMINISICIRYDSQYVSYMTGSDNLIQIVVTA